MNTKVEANLPAETLERRAAEQRQRIHESVGELKTTLEETIREKLDVRSYAREHFGALAAGASFFAFIAGFGIAGMFTRH